MSRVYVLGSLRADLTTHAPRLPRPGETVRGGSLRRTAGGRGGGQAVAAAAAGAEVVMVGAVGADEHGVAYRRRLQARGVDVTHVRVVDGEATAQAFVTVDEQGARTTVVAPGADAELAPHHMAVLDTMAVGDVLLVSLELPHETVAEAVRRVATRDVRVVLHASPYARLPMDVVGVADPLVVDEQEALALADDGSFPASLLVTFGAAGVSWNGVQHSPAPVPAAEVVDAQGADDAFAGTLAAHLSLGATQAAAVAAACEAWAAAVRREGAQPQPLL